MLHAYIMRLQEIQQTYWRQNDADSERTGSADADGNRQTLQQPRKRFRRPERNPEVHR